MHYNLDDRVWGLVRVRVRMRVTISIANTIKFAEYQHYNIDG